MTKNRVAFLHMLAISEGTQIIGNNQGYDVIVGSTPQKSHLFLNFDDHPRVLVKLSPKLSSTAAGRYQVLAKYYDAYKKQLGLPDFSPDSQDKIALQMISECNALHLVDAGNFQEAVRACSSHWASLPNSPYGQHTNKLSVLQTAYVDAGGIVA